MEFRQRGRAVEIAYEVVDHKASIADLLPSRTPPRGHVV